VIHLSTKTYTGFPCCHRQHRHDGHCSYIHGYSRTYSFVFGAKQRDKCGFVVDFGNLKWLKEHLDYMYDHTLLVNSDDPELPVLREQAARGVYLLREVENASMEGTAEYLFNYANGHLSKVTNGRCFVVSVEARENEKNSAIFGSLYLPEHLSDLGGH